MSGFSLIEMAYEILQHTGNVISIILQDITDYLVSTALQIITSIYYIYNIKGQNVYKLKRKSNNNFSICSHLIGTRHKTRRVNPPSKTAGKLDGYLPAPLRFLLFGFTDSFTGTCFLYFLFHSFWFSYL